MLQRIYLTKVTVAKQQLFFPYTETYKAICKITVARKCNKHYHKLLCKQFVKNTQINKP